MEPFQIVVTSSIVAGKATQYRMSVELVEATDTFQKFRVYAADREMFVSRSMLVNGWSWHATNVPQARHSNWATAGALVRNIEVAIEKALGEWKKSSRRWR